jgi:hypothetical protein
VGRFSFELDSREPALLALWIGNTGLLEDLACHWARRLSLGPEFGFERAVVNGGDGRAVIGRAQHVSVNSIRSNESEN